MDRQQIDRIMAGDKRAFQALYDELIDRALRTAVALVKDRDLAKDAVQETMIRVYKNLGSYDPDKPFEPWFYRILINECNRLLKKEARVHVLTRFYDERDSHVADGAKEDYSELYQAIQSLNDLYRVPIVLKYLQGFTEKEIAEVLKLNQNTVKSRLFKGREKLKQSLAVSSKGGLHCGN